MSRFSYEEYLGDDADLAYGRWEGRVRAVLRGRPAQEHFRELEAALLAMPEKRLIEGTLSDGQYACAVGEIAVARRVRAGEDRAAVLASLKPDGDEDGPYEDQEAGETARFAQKTLGMSYTLGWLMAEANDELFGSGSHTPEQRWAAMLRWTRQHIRTAEGPCSGSGQPPAELRQGRYRTRGRCSAGCGWFKLKKDGSTWPHGAG